MIFDSFLSSIPAIINYFKPHNAANQRAAHIALAIRLDSTQYTQTKIESSASARCRTSKLLGRRHLQQ
jgi:hypothetical protein